MTAPLRTVAATLCVALAALASPAARAADDCAIALGRGWPPATENHGAAVERLLDGGLTPALRLTRLPAFATESGVLLIPGEGEGDWTLRVAEADDRVSRWSGGRLELRVDQTPDAEEVPMPAPLARRLVDAWQRTFTALVPADRPAAFHEGPSSFAVGDLRVSGLEPECGPGQLVMAQVELLVEASEDGDERRARRWAELAASIDELEQTLAGLAGGDAGEANGND